MSSCVGCSQKAYEILNFYLTSLRNFKHTSVKLNCIDMITKLKCTKIVNFITTCTRYEVIVPGCGHIDDFMKMIDFIRNLYFVICKGKLIES